MVPRSPVVAHLIRQSRGMRRGLGLGRGRVNAGLVGALLGRRKLPAHLGAGVEPGLAAQHDLLAVAELAVLVADGGLQRDVEGVVAQLPAGLLALGLQQHAPAVAGDQGADLGVQVEADHEGDEAAPVYPAAGGERNQPVLAAQLVGRDVEV